MAAVGTDDEATWWIWSRARDRKKAIEAGDPAGAALCEAVMAALDLHDEDEPSALSKRGHWEGHGVNERWIRTEPNECPVDGGEAPCKTVRLLGVPFAQETGYRENWKP